MVFSIRAEKMRSLLCHQYFRISNSRLFVTLLFLIALCGTTERSLTRRFGHTLLSFVLALLLIFQIICPIACRIHNPPASIINSKFCRTIVLFT